MPMLSLSLTHTHTYMHTHTHTQNRTKQTAAPWVAVGKLVDGAARKLLRIVLLDLLVRHAVAHAGE
jgi:hypothetical protein